MTNLLNPKAIIFTLSFFPLFINPHVCKVGQQMLFLGMILVMIMIAVELPLVLCAGSIGRRLNADPRPARNIARSAGLILLGVAGYIGYSRLLST